jgi:hypothetical protein
MIVGANSMNGHHFVETAYDYDREIWSQSTTVWTEDEKEGVFYEEGSYQVWVQA